MSESIFARLRGLIGSPKRIIVLCVAAMLLIGIGWFARGGRPSY